MNLKPHSCNLFMANLLIVSSSIIVTMPAFALPQVATNHSQDATASTNTDPDVAATTHPNPLSNPESLASQMQPTYEALSQANQDLLSRNAQLQRDINDLSTQVDVLVEERSGQLFMFGALTVITSLIFGFFIGWVVYGRRDRW